MDFKSHVLPAQKRIVLIAHDNKKQELIDWTQKNLDVLAHHTLYATGTTGYKLEAALQTPIQKFTSGPLGGDQQVGAKIAEGAMDILIFFWDPFEPMPHDPDVKALLRVAAVWNIPVACNPASADFILHSKLLAETYERLIPDYEKYIQARTQ